MKSDCFVLADRALYLAIAGGEKSFELPEQNACVVSAA
jgi:hypothetical protein